MNVKFLLVVTSAIGLGACDVLESGIGGAGSADHITELPESVRTIAAPGQDLTAVRVDPADGCLVYRHVGPVETTYLPLRTTKGRPICTKVDETAQEA